MNPLSLFRRLVQGVITSVKSFADSSSETASNPGDNLYAPPQDRPLSRAETLEAKRLLDAEQLRQAQLRQEQQEIEYEKERLRQSLNFSIGSGYGSPDTIFINKFTDCFTEYNAIIAEKLSASPNNTTINQHTVTAIRYLEKIVNPLESQFPKLKPGDIASEILDLLLFNACRPLATQTPKLSDYEFKRPLTIHTNLKAELLDAFKQAKNLTKK